MWKTVYCIKINVFLFSHFCLNQRGNDHIMQSHTITIHSFIHSFITLSRWLTTTKPSNELNSLTHIVVYSYGPMWFIIKCKDKFIDEPQTFGETN